MYITKNDYKGRILTELLNAILTRTIQDTPGVDEAFILSEVSKTAEDIITGYASKLYDITPEFAKTTTARNYQVLNWALNIALYLLYQRIEDYDVPQKVIKNHDDTIEDLQKLSIGKFNINLPAAPVDETEDENGGQTGNGLRRFGSSAPRSHRI